MKCALIFATLALVSFASQAGEGRNCHQSRATGEYMAAMRQMHFGMNVPYTGDPDTDFAAGMIPHHQGAVDMAKTELAYGKDPEMRALAKNIIFTQEQEIAWMLHWVDVRGGIYTDDNAESTGEFKQAEATMHQAMNIGYTGHADVDFARGMIPHHQGAVDMAAVVVRHGRTPEMVKFAQGVISTQLAEIHQMKKWLEKQPNFPVSKPKPMNHTYHE